MRWLCGLMLATAIGCHTCRIDVPLNVERHVADVAAVPACADVAPHADAGSVSWPEGPLDLNVLWDLALEHNPALREAAADVEAARGKQIQASKYPNPRITYEEEELGTSQAAAGSVRVVVNQEIVTAGKHRLDRAIAARGINSANVALLGRKFEELTRIRRAFYEYQGWVYTAQVNDEVVTALQQGVETTRKLVEEVKSRPRTDLLRLQALLEEARINQSRSQVNVESAWRQLLAEVGVPNLSLRQVALKPGDAFPHWDADAVTARVLAANTDLKQAAFDVDRARLEVERARAEAVPNLTLGGGYSRNFAENEAGAVVSVEAPLPIWDRKQGQIYEARARWARAQAGARTVVDRLRRETAEALGRFQGTRHQVERLTTVVLPRHEESLKLIREGYQAGAAQLSFADVLLAEQTLNDTRLKLAEARREFWRAVADLQGLMQLDIGEELDMPARSASDGPVAEPVACAPG